MVDVVVLASPPRNPIRSNTASGDASERCTRAAPRRLLLPWSSKYVERWVGSTTRRRGAIGGEFLQQGFAYTQSGGRERGGKQGDWLEGKVWGGGAPPTLFI